MEIVCKEGGGHQNNDGFSRRLMDRLFEIPSFYEAIWANEFSECFRYFKGKEANIPEQLKAATFYLRRGDLLEIPCLTQMLQSSNNGC
ncbi:hypothetical protein TNIN_430181 [Trichonephila inaurata madagascariensis]|uniref:Uncharacterized protein n=1 Tax=Trichonephila inaurata madagascariensis TaxID=2747483 RepID=A0A8X6XXA2_9ARAC|nr:hypothetical protein TNIN_430181 [Trichonephila inaurata madagascariensis]